MTDWCLSYSTVCLLPSRRFNDSGDLDTRSYHCTYVDFFLCFLQRVFAESFSAGRCSLLVYLLSGCLRETKRALCYT